MDATTPDPESLAEVDRLFCVDDNPTVSDLKRAVQRALAERDARIAALEAEVAYREEARVNQLLVTDLCVKALEALIRSREYITDPKGKAPVFCPWCDSRPHAENCKAKEVLDA